MNTVCNFQILYHNVVIVHCLLYHENLASRMLSHELKKMMQEIFFKIFFKQIFFKEIFLKQEIFNFKKSNLFY